MSQTELSSAMRENPNDAFLQSQQLQSKMQLGTEPGITNFFRDYDALIAQHPMNVALWRNRLRLSTRGNLVSPNYLNPLAQGPKGRIQYAVWLDASGIEKVVVQAKAAQKVDADEAFFPWVEGMALWGLGRKDEAVKALERAGNCRRFNDGSMDEVRQDMMILNRYQPLDWDDKLGGVWAALLPHFAGMRELAHQVSDSGTERYGAGDKAEAWRRWEVALKAGHLLRVSQSRGASATSIGILVGEAIEQVAWGSVAQGAGNFRLELRPDGGSNLQESLRRAEESLRVFMRVARRDGRTELARWVAQDGQAIAARRSSLAHGGNWIDIFDRKMGWKTPVARATLQMRWVGLHAMLWALTGAVAWVVSLSVSRGGRDTRTGTNTVALLSAFFGALWLGVAVLAVLDNAGFKEHASILMFGEGDLDTSVLGWSIDWDRDFWWAVGATFLLAALGREWGARRLALRNSASRDKARLPHPPFWKVAGIAAWTLAAVLSLCLWFDGTNESSLNSVEALLWFCWALSLGLGVGTAWQGQKNNGAEGERPFAFALMTALALGVFILSSRAQHSDAAAWGCLLLCPLTVGLWMWNGRRGLWSWGRIVTNLEMGGRVIANVSLMIAAGYLAASLALWPARQQLNTRVDRYVEVGEVDWLNAQTK